MVRACHPASWRGGRRLGAERVRARPYPVAICRYGFVDGHSNSDAEVSALVAATRSVQASGGVLGPWESGRRCWRSRCRFDAAIISLASRWHGTRRKEFWACWEALQGARAHQHHADTFGCGLERARLAMGSCQRLGTCIAIHESARYRQACAVHAHTPLHRASRLCLQVQGYCGWRAGARSGGARAPHEVCCSSNLHHRALTIATSLCTRALLHGQCG